jgi:hypothetical protein
MSDLTVNPQHFVDVQADVLRLAKARYALSTARLSALTEIPETTIASWSKGTSMPAWAMMALAIHIPRDLMNLLAEQAGLQLTPVEHQANDLDQLACEASGFTHELLEAKRDGKVTPIERDRLKEKARRVAVAASSIA